MKARGQRKMRTRPCLVMGPGLCWGTSSLAGHPLVCRMEKLLPCCAGIIEEPAPSQVCNQTCGCGTHPCHVLVLPAILHCWCLPPLRSLSPTPGVPCTHHPLVWHSLGEHLVEPPAFPQDRAKHQGGPNTQQAEPHLMGGSGRGLKGQL